MNHLPDAAWLLFPELRDVDLSEPAATCDKCVLTAENSGDDPGLPWVFDPETRCCTFNPRLPNFSAGRVLRAGGLGADKLMERLQQREGITTWGIFPPADFTKRYDDIEMGEFGRDVSLRCPYWVGGTLSCGIWTERPAACLSWSCRFKRGPYGFQRAAAAYLAVKWLENHLTLFCIAVGEAPPVTATPDEWASWYRWCADRIDEMSARELTRIGDNASLRDLRELLRRRLVDERPPLPDLVVPSVQYVWNVEERVRLGGFHSYDTVWAPRSIYLFFSKLDGTVTWQQALTSCRDEGTTDLDEALIAELYRIDAVRSPVEGDIRGAEGEMVVQQVQGISFGDDGVHVDFFLPEPRRPS